ncbi:superoxide dismutase, Fe-Mn family [Pseudobutyrivibrio sp. NOR37]|uniref:Superoxide dismutase n=1 Tax=Pseudobutyrivibrio xylanivorans TaxID=185007 RepID=A0A6M0LIL5_PSEXY|nr:MULTISPECIES: superoxide dismutase [Pseudobutyrivibrio]NEX02345.1 superoxide dismutase [Pseudobutyrivibrio xylanivorans]SFR78356.1 superoxide dismutase, Fe-Mn family [Pseudobutyrivibrio sp. NOR37]
MFEQIKLPYATNALEPYIDQLTVETHHGKHHATYTKTFNELAEKAGMADLSAEELLASLDKVGDATLRQGLKNQGGGFYNHNLYFEMFSPSPAKAPTGKLAQAIDDTFGGLDALKEQLTTAATTQFGSGWAWLSTDKSGKLTVSKTANQDNPISEGTGMIPLVALDVWEHAYYLKYKNLRPDYIKAFFEVLDWAKVSARYEEIVG